MTTIQLTIEGMTCDGCRRRAEKALARAAGVTNATVSLEQKSAIVSGEALDPAVLKAILEKAGFSAGTPPVG